jgi:hypothetical protein
MRRTSGEIVCFTSCWPAFQAADMLYYMGATAEYTAEMRRTSGILWGLEVLVCEAFSAILWGLNLLVYVVLTAEMHGTWGEGVCFASCWPAVLAADMLC